MNLKLSRLWRSEGEIERGLFFLLALALFAVKFNLDRLLAWLWFGSAWSIFDWQHASVYLWQTLPARNEGPFYALLLAVSLPFIGAGLMLTLQRLRSIGWSPWWTVLVFVPGVKLIFFALLCVMPSWRQRETEPVEPGNLKQWIGRCIPRGGLAAATLGVALTLALAVGGTLLGTVVLRDYGWALFVGMPFGMGFLSVLIYGFHQPRGVGGCLGVSIASVLLSGVGLLFFAMEGIICLIMAAPLAAGMALVGGLVGYSIQKAAWWHHQSPRLFCTVLIALPAVMGLEHAAPPELPLLAVKSSLIVHAPPERVWQHVVSFAELPPPTEWMFRLGVAYPVRAEISGRGVGAVRHCNFSTGPFVEPIEVWDEPRLLKFSVTQNPAPMQEWTPYRDVHPPHLDNYLESKGGQFRLVPLADGRTLLEGTTWYHHHLWPASYWQVWSDFIIHKIHLRVLRHVKGLAEMKEP